jgi:hypothetical protein
MRDATKPAFAGGTGVYKRGKPAIVGRGLIVLEPQVFLTCTPRC